MAKADTSDKKGRGRPKLSDEEKASRQAEKKKSDNDGPKRSRGRPKGSLNKKKGRRKGTKVATKKSSKD